MTTMFICESNGDNIPTDTEAYYEAIASQEEIYLEEEEIYLEETEEELRVILECDDPPPPRQQEHAAEELITGDSDDPPLSKEAVEEMLAMA
jgi:hypothetical protein